MRILAGAAVILLFTFADVATASRRPLNPPELVRFAPCEWVADEYLHEVKRLEALAEKFDSNALLEASRRLCQTLDQVELLDAVSSIEQAATELLAGGRAQGIEDALKEFSASSPRLRTMVSEGDYLKGRHPIEVEVASDMHIYRIQWRGWTGQDWSGPRSLLTVPFVPEMEIRVAASYEPSLENGSYGYRIVNGNRSRAGVGIFWIEAVGLTKERQEMLRERYGASLRVSVNKDQYVRLGLPKNGSLQEFRFATFKNSDQTLRLAPPGGSLEVPPVLAVTWKQLPGVVDCWVEADRYQTGLSAHRDPEIATLVFDGRKKVSGALGEKWIPTDWYSGRTMGPIPVPEPTVSRADFLERIRAHLSEAGRWGWVSPENVAQHLDERLLELAGDSSPHSLAGLIREVEKLHDEGVLLEEAFVLLKYNLQYLAESRWGER